MKILITGANGFIGSHLIQALILKGHFVVGLDRQKESLIKKINKYFSGDVLDKKTVKRAMEKVEVVVHLAALTVRQEVTNNKIEALEVNVLGTKNILDAFLKSKSAKKFLFSSSGKVYGNIKSLPFIEKHPTLPLAIDGNLYGKSKLIAEKLIDFYANQEKSFIIFRIFNVFGPGQKDNFLVPTILNRIKESNEIISGNIKVKRDYIYIKDVAAAFALTIEKKINAGLSIFNICSGKPTSVKEIVSEISKIKKNPIKIKIDTSLSSLSRKDEKDIEYGSYKKIKEVLGWQPKYSLKKGLKELIRLTK